MKLGTLAEIEVRECPHEEHWYRAPAVWAECDDPEAVGWFLLNGTGFWWFDTAAFRRPLVLVPADAEQPALAEVGPGS